MIPAMPEETFSKAQTCFKALQGSQNGSWLHCGIQFQLRERYLDTVGGGIFYDPAPQSKLRLRIIIQINSHTGISNMLNILFITGTPRQFQ
jgi:hypothetical protein